MYEFKRAGRFARVRGPEGDVRFHFPTVVERGPFVVGTETRLGLRADAEIAQKIQAVSEEARAYAASARDFAVDILPTIERDGVFVVKILRGRGGRERTRVVDASGVPVPLERLVPGTPVHVDVETLGFGLQYPTGRVTWHANAVLVNSV